MTIPIYINTNEVSIYPNETAPKHIVLSPQASVDNYTLYIKSGSPTSKLKSPMGVTPDKYNPRNRIDKIVSLSTKTLLNREK